MIDFIKKEWRRLQMSTLRRLIYLMVIAVILGLLANKYNQSTVLSILVLLPFIYLAYVILKVIIYAWIINPYNTWKERKDR